MQLYIFINLKIIAIVKKHNENYIGFILNIFNNRELFCLLTLSGAHFSGASTPDMIVTIRVFGAADYESEVRFSKFKMVDPICRSKFSKKGNLMLNFGYKGFWDR